MMIRRVQRAFDTLSIRKASRKITAIYILVSTIVGEYVEMLRIGFIYVLAIALLIIVVYRLFTNHRWYEFALAYMFFFLAPPR